MSSPVSATVAANLGPEAMPTCARNTVSPKLRSTRFADNGSVHTIPARAAERAERRARPAGRRPVPA